MVSSIFSLASSSSMLLVLVFLSFMADSNPNFNISPSFVPFFDIDNICDQVNCGRGNCSADQSKPFSFVCECDPGWQQARSDDKDDIQFLPCVIPNCTLDYSCMPAPPPSPPIPNNISFFDPCYWTYCGEGTCTKSNTFKHTCDCNPGYTNLMNITHFPCFSSCAIGTDCSRLGIRVLDANSPGGDSNQGTKFIHGSFYWIGITVISVVMTLWK